MKLDGLGAAIPGAGSKILKESWKLIKRYSKPVAKSLRFMKKKKTNEGIISGLVDGWGIGTGLRKVFESDDKLGALY